MRPCAVCLFCIFCVLCVACGEDTTAPSEPGSAVAATAAAPRSLTFAQISAGNDHACGTTTDGRAWCWGSNGVGQLGLPLEQTLECFSNKPCSTRPVAAGGALRFRHVAAGWGFSCGVATDDKVYCWGANDVGQLGRGSSAAFSSTPAPVAGNRKYRQVRVGYDAACAITRARTVFCWGGNSRGQLGNGSATPSSTPVPVAFEASWVQLTLGVNDACGIIKAQSQVRCWGNNAAGQFGNGTLNSSNVPVSGGGAMAFDQIDTGFDHTCGVAADARVLCWGDGYGVGDGLGLGTRPSPVPVSGNRKWANVSAGSLFSCGVTVTGRGFCWGSGAGGALGNGTNLNQFKPVAVAGSLSFIAISAGSGFSCGVATTGQGWCWGDDVSGQLGDGSVVTKMAPSAVLGPRS